MLKPNYIRFLGLTFDIPQTYQELCTAQYRQLSYALQTGLEIPTLRLLILLIIFQIPNKIKRFILNLYIKVANLDFLHRLIPFTDFVLKNYYELPTPYGLLQRKKSMSFIEFIRLHYYFMLLATVEKEKHDHLLNCIIATVFHFEGKKYDDDSVEPKAEVVQHLHPYIKYSIVQDIRRKFDELINYYDLVFPKTTGSNGQTNAAQTQEMWFKVARQRAENITNLDEVLYADASIILFDYNEGIDEYNQTKKMYENN